jgi:hypothetical protein
MNDVQRLPLTIGTDISGKDDASVGHLNALLASVAPLAVFAKPLHLVDLRINEQRVRVLDCMGKKLSNQDLAIFVGRKLKKLSDDNFHAVFYRVQGHPDVICLDIKADSAEQPLPRHFWIGDWQASAAKLNSTPMGEALRNKQAPLAMTPSTISDEALAMDKEWLKLVRMKPSEAVHSGQAVTQRFDARGNDEQEGKKIALTLINDTHFDISFDVARNLRINGKPISIYPESDCYTHAYELDGHPNIICFNENDLKNPLQHYTLFSAWVTPYETSMVLEPKITPYPWRHLVDARFLNKKITFDTELLKNSQFKLLQSSLSPYAVATASARLSTIKERDSQLLNLTAHDIKIDVEGDLFVDKHYIGKYPEHLAIVAYQVSNPSNVICFDSVNSHNQLRQRRFVETGRFRAISYGLYFSCPLEPLAMPDAYIVDGLKRPWDQAIAFDLPSDATLKENPRISCFKIPKEINRNWRSHSFMVINHTDQELTIDACENLCINGRPLKCIGYPLALSEMTHHLIAYHTSGNENVIHIGRWRLEHFKFNRGLCRAPDHVYQNARLDVAIERLFNSIWKGTYDPQSCLYRYAFTHDVTIQIVLLYLRVMSLKVSAH